MTRQSKTGTLNTSCDHCSVHSYSYEPQWQACFVWNQLHIVSLVTPTAVTHKVHNAQERGVFLESSYQQLNRFLFCHVVITRLYTMCTTCKDHIGRFIPTICTRVCCCHHVRHDFYTIKQRHS